MSTEHESELPCDPEYWDRLAQRVTADAAGPLAAYASDATGPGNGDWYQLLARRASWLVAASAAAALIMWLSLPARTSIALEWIERSLSPSDGPGTLVDGEAPPTVNELLVQFSPTTDEEGRR